MAFDRTVIETFCQDRPGPVKGTSGIIACGPGLLFFISHAFTSRLVPLLTRGQHVGELDRRLGECSRGEGGERGAAGMAHIARQTPMDENA